MEIAEIKSKLSIDVVLTSYNLTPDSNNRLCCPWHNDKTPSLQIYPETNTWTCFSSNCNAGSGDVIDFIMKYEKITKHEALKRATEWSGGEVKTSMSKIAILTKYNQEVRGGLESNDQVRAYLEQRGLDASKLEMGYCGYDIGEGWKKTLKSNAEKIGLLKIKNCITFAMRNKKDQVVSIYGRSISQNANVRHFYLQGGFKGLYPSYPKQETKRLVLTESIIDAATIKQYTDHEVLAMYGTNGFTKEHAKCISEFKELEEVIFFLDGDEAGRKAIEKWSAEISQLNKKVKVSFVETPEGEDVNSLIQGHQPNILDHLIENRKPIAEQQDLFFSIEKKSSGLDIGNPNKLMYTTEIANYYIKGGIRKDLDSLKVTLVVEHKETLNKSRTKLDLYEDKQTDKISREASEKLDLRLDLIERDLHKLTDLLDDYRESRSEESGLENEIISLTELEKEQSLKLLKTKNLLDKINELIGKSGVVGEQNNRIFLFVIASSYKMEDTLHALIQGSTGSGKTHLLNMIMEFMPKEDCTSLTRVTESSFYNYGKYELRNKLIGIEDYDGLEEKAELAFRELQSKGMISSSTSGKNESSGKIEAFIKEVYGPIASLSATTRGQIYEDNMSRSFLVSVDESQEQTLKIIGYQNDKSAGLIDKQKEKQIRAYLRNAMRMLETCEVINPFANKIDLPKQAHKIRRLNDLFQSFIKQVTLINQYQRKKDAQGRLITDKQDVKTAISIMFDSIILKVDELDGALRDFYERLKKYVESKSRDYEFSRREIRHYMRLSNTQTHRYFSQLNRLEYIYRSSGHDNRGHKYKVGYWDNMQSLRAQIQQDLNDQIEKL